MMAIRQPSLYSNHHIWLSSFEHSHLWLFTEIKSGQTPNCSISPPLFFFRPLMSLYLRRRLFCSLLLLLLVLSALVTLSFFFDLETITKDALPDYVSLLLPDRDSPPKYKKLRKWIHDLPQHDLNLPFPEGRNGRYVKFTCQVQQLGWNNLLNEVCVS